MKRILLISNYVFHYRQKVYNYFFSEFKKYEYEFHVLSDKYQDVDFAVNFKKHVVKKKFKRYKRIIQEINPDVIILFLHLKDYVMFPLMLYCRINKIPVIYWNHGINIADPDSKLKNFLFHRIHDFCDALITYSPDMRKYFSEKNQKKLFVAYNTLNFTDIDKSRYSKKHALKKYGIAQAKVVLFVARIKPQKELNVLVDLLQGRSDIALVIVGSGMPGDIMAVIDSVSHYYYLGPRYGDEMNEIFNMADVFCIPRYIGLAMNEALFWNLPACLLKGPHGPEVYYMKDGKTGYMADNLQDYKDKIERLVDDAELNKKMRQGCEEEFIKEASIEKMFAGFWDAVKYCES